jgi:hypothetical protein
LYFINKYSKGKNSVKFTTPVIKFRVNNAFGSAVSVIVSFDMGIMLQFGLGKFDVIIHNQIFVVNRKEINFLHIIVKTNAFEFPAMPENRFFS